MKLGILVLPINDKIVCVFERTIKVFYNHIIVLAINRVRPKKVTQESDSDLDTPLRTPGHGNQCMIPHLHQFLLYDQKWMPYTR